MLSKMIDLNLPFYSSPLRAVACNHGAVRLAGMNSNGSNGRVEVCANETWGTICDGSWGDADAGVVCAALGFSRFSMFNNYSGLQ